MQYNDQRVFRIVKSSVSSFPMGNMYTMFMFYNDMVFEVR